MTNETTDCYLHLYNYSGNHLLQREMSFSSNNVDFELDIKAGNFSYIGEYTIIAWCNNTVYLGGYTSGIARATINGKNGTFNVALILAIALLSSLLLITYHTLKEEHWLMKTILMFFIPLLFILAGGFTNIASSGTIYENLGASAYKTIIWLVRIFYTYVVISLLIKVLNVFAKQNKTK